MSSYMFEFFGLPEPSPVDTTVKVWTDPSIIERKTVKTLSSIDKLLMEEDDKASKEGMSRTQRMGAKNTQDMNQRLTILANAIDVDGITTTKEALSYLTSIRTETSVVKYLKILGKRLKNERGVLVGADTPQLNLLMGSSNSHNNPIIDYKYYTKDPNEGGVELTKEQYAKHRKEIIEGAGKSFIVSKNKEAK